MYKESCPVCATQCGAEFPVGDICRAPHKIVSLEFSDPLSDEELKALRQLLLDAMGEFQDARMPADAYVRRRYAYIGEVDPNKVAEVESRIRLASKVKRCRIL